ncbi:DUF3515 domain-containing protein [Okibacterium endophyticum]
MRALVSAAVISLALSGCSPTLNLDPAADAGNPQCAEVSVRLPDRVADLPERETNAQATGAWGDPAGVILHCGVAVPGPTTDPCHSVNGVDWIEDASRADEDIYVFTTYGRDPAVEVVIDASLASGTTALTDLATAVSVLPTTTECVGAADVLE